METCWDQPTPHRTASHAYLPPYTSMARSGLHPTGWHVGPWRASLAVEELCKCQTISAWLQALDARVLHAMLGPTMAANSQVGPCWVCQREALWHPSWLS